MNFDVNTTQTFNIALYDRDANLNENTIAYTTEDEIPNERGYTTGGMPLVISTRPTSDKTTALVSFNDVSWPNATFNVRGALIYSVGAGNPAVAVLDFGVDKAAVGTFIITFPMADADNAIIRIT